MSDNNKFLQTAALIFCGTIAFISGCSKQPQMQMPPTPVVVAPVTKAKITVSDTFVGQTLAYDSVDFVARVEGFLKKRNFDEGAFVKKGDLLFLIEQEPYKAKVDAAEGVLNEALANLKDANVDFKRYEGLFGKEAASKRDYEKAETTKLTAEAKVLSAKASLEQAKINLGYTEVQAPFDGKMSIAAYSEGNLVNASSGKLASIVRRDLIKVEFHVSEIIMTEYLLKNTIKGTAKLAPIQVNLLLPNGQPYEHQGRVDYFDNAVSPTTGTVRLQAVFPNPDNILMPGMYVKVMEPWEHENAILIPASAVQEDQGGPFVMVVNKNTVNGKEANLVSMRRIKLDNRPNGSNMIVKSGLKEGEIIVVDGLQKIRTGMPVTPIPAGAGASPDIKEASPAAKDSTPKTPDESQSK